MDPDWVATWLHNLNLAEYRDNFCSNGYTTYELCSQITEKEELKRIGVLKVGHVNRLFRAVEKLRSDGEPSAWSQSPLDNADTPGPRQSATMPPTRTKLSLSVSAGGLTNSGSRNPPPIPMRRSLRRNESSPSSSPTVQRAPQGVQQAAANAESLPPPVLPRQQSLKTDNKPQSALNIKIRRRADTEGEGSEDSQKPAGSELSPIPQSPAVLAGGESSQGGTQFPLERFQTDGQNVSSSVAQSAATTATENHLSHSPQDDPDGNHLPRVSPRPDKKLSGKGSLGKPPPPPVRKESDPSLSPVPPSRDDSTGQQVPPSQLNGGSGPGEISEGSNRIQSPTSPSGNAPALPPKTKRIIIPKGNVVFELENEPMPQPLNDAGKTQNGLPPALPPKDAGVPNFTPPPPPRNQAPPPPPRVSTLIRDSSSDALPPPPTPVQQPPLPSRDPGVPNFKPPPPQPEPPSPDVPLGESSPPSSDTGTHNALSPPVLPPKDLVFPPPPPPITAEDFPEEEEDDDDDSEKEEGPLMCISSAVGGTRDSILLVLEGGADSASNSPSPFSSPEHTSGTLIRQQLSPGANLDDIILTSPSPINADYMNDEALFSKTRDYANQDAIDESIQIHGTSPIKSRSINRETDRDYENQEVLDEDIIPVSVHQPNPPPHNINLAGQEGLEVSSPSDSPSLPPKQSSRVTLGFVQHGREMSPDRTVLTTSGSEASTPDAQLPPRPPLARDRPNVSTRHTTGSPRPLARDGPNVPARNTTGTPRPRPSVKPVPKPRSQTHGIAPRAEEDSDSDRTPETGPGVVAPYSGSGGISDREHHAPQPQVDALAVEQGGQLSSSAPRPATDVFDGVRFFAVDYWGNITILKEVCFVCPF